jgi:hypothetical protein
MVKVIVTKDDYGRIIVEVGMYEMVEPSAFNEPMLHAGFQECELVRVVDGRNGKLIAEFKKISKSEKQR